MITLTEQLPPNAQAAATHVLALTADERVRSRHWFETESGDALYLNLPRGTVLQHGDLLRSDAHNYLVRIVAKPEPVLTVTAKHPIDLLRAAYHLGNRHVSLEVQINYLRLTPDPVLKQMLIHMGLQVEESLLPFQPETGAYGSHH